MSSKCQQPEFPQGKLKYITGKVSGYNVTIL